MIHFCFTLSRKLDLYYFLLWLFGLVLMFFLNHNTWLCRHVYLPWERTMWHDDSMCSKVPLFPQRGQSGVSARSHLCRFAGVGSTSSTDRRRNWSWNCRYLQISAQVSALWSVSHLVQAPWQPSPTAITHLVSSCLDWTSFWTTLHLSAASAFVQKQLFVIPKPWLPTAMAPTMSLCCNLLSASSPTFVANHFFFVLSSTPASCTLSSFKSEFANYTKYSFF